MKFYNCEIIKQGSIVDTHNDVHSFWFAHNNRDARPNFDCRKSWLDFKLSLLGNYSVSNDDELFSLIDRTCFHDIHWNWNNKFSYYKDENKYDWFYIATEDEIQAIALTSHPVESEFDNQPIFYIEYIAVAPWNRKSDCYERRFSGVGSLLIKCISNYFADCHNYRYGFALAAVPQAEGFYRKIGMTAIPDKNHDGLLFFEFMEQNASSFIKG